MELFLKERCFYICRVIILAGLFWGTSGIFVHYIAPYGIYSIQMTAIRGTVSCLVIGLYLPLKDKNLFKIKISQIPLFHGAGLGMFFAAYCYYTSMQMTSVAISVMLMYTAPLFVMAYSVAFMGEKFIKIKGISVAAMFVGCGLVSGIIGDRNITCLV